MLTLVLGTFVTWYYWEEGSVSPQVMGTVARQSFMWIVSFHVISIFGVATGGRVVDRGRERSPHAGLSTRHTAGQRRDRCRQAGLFDDRILLHAGRRPAGHDAPEHAGEHRFPVDLAHLRKSRVYGIFPRVALDLGLDRCGGQHPRRPPLDAIDRRLAGPSFFVAYILLLGSESTCLASPRRGMLGS